MSSNQSLKWSATPVALFRWVGLRMKQSGKVIWKLVVQCVIPLFLSGSYAAWDYYSSSLSTTASFFKSWGGAFFFLMWLIGLYQRLAKQSADEENWSSVKTDVGSIKGMLNDLANKLSGAPLAASQSTKFTTTSVNQAQQAFQAGYKQAALLAAAVEYEHSIRQFAQRFNIIESERTPVTKLIHSLQPIVGPNVFRELLNLWRARNLLVHGSKDQLTEERMNQLFDSILWAIGYLSGIEYRDES